MNGGYHSDADLANYPYAAADLEQVRPSQIRPGDFMAFRGPVGTGRWVGDRVLRSGYGGTAGIGGELYLIEVRQTNGGYETEFRQPESMPVWRVRKDRIKRVAA
jgi:hypothetical protein